MQNVKVIIATVKSWNIKNVQRMSINNVEIILISTPEQLVAEKIKEINPKYIFFIHWSWYIPKDIYDCYECIVFHPARVPYGRGGSPIQNLIIRGEKETVISAIKVGEKLDAGAVYLTYGKLCLEGTADEILMRMSKVVCFNMIPWILSHNPVPIEQEGDVVTFLRRKPNESVIDFAEKIENIYDMIRMLDGEGYPNAFINIGKYKLSFSRASMHTEGIIADVLIEELEDIDE